MSTSSLGIGGIGARAVWPVVLLMAVVALAVTVNASGELSQGEPSRPDHSSSVDQSTRSLPEPKTKRTPRAILPLFSLISQRKAPNHRYRLSRPVSRKSHNTAYSLLSNYVKNHFRNFTTRLGQRARSHKITFQNETTSTKTDALKDATDDIKRQDNVANNDAVLNASSKSVEHSAYLSPTINVIDVGTSDTKIAHNILVVRKTPKPNSELITPPPVLVSSNNKHYLVDSKPEVSITRKPIFEDATLEFVPIKNNHRPSTFMSFAKWRQKNKHKLGSSTTTTQLLVSVTPKPTVIASSEVSSRSSTTSPSPSSTLLSSTHWHVPSVVTTPTAIIANPTQSSSESQSESSMHPHYETVPMESSTNASLLDNTAMTTDRVTEFDLPATQWPVQTGSSSSSSALGSDLLGSGGLSVITLNELVTANPMDGTLPTTSGSESAAWTTSQNDDSSIQLLKEYSAEQQSSGSSGTVMTSTQSPAISESTVPFYHHTQQQSHHSDEKPRPSDESIIVFKNNHIRQKKPIPAYKPSTKFTAKPPYVTDFNYPTTVPARRTSISVANIVGNRIKQPEEIKSGTLTVLDPPFVPSSMMQLPLNTTIVHKNLLVPMKEGRPKPSYPSRPTTHFPVYPVVAGVSNWQSQTTPWFLPSITTSPPYEIDEILPAGSSSSNFTFDVNDFDHQIFTTSTPKPSKSVTKVVEVGAVKPSASTPSPPRRVSSSSTASSTTSSPRPSTSSTYVNAIYAPPMPIFRPTGPISGNHPGLFTRWFTRLRRYVSSLLPNTGSANFLSVLRSAIYSLMVMLLPPIALLSFFA